MTPQPDFKAAIVAFNKINSACWGDEHEHNVDDLDFIAEHRETIRTALLGMDALMQEPTEMMYMAGKHAIAECARHSLKSVAAYCFAAMRDELLKGIL